MRYVFVVFLVALAACSTPQAFPAPQNISESFIESPDVNVEEWVTNLEVPWSLVFINDSHALVSERPGRIRLIINGALQEEPYYVFDSAHASGEGGLMGLAHHNNFTYAMLTTRQDNRVVRLTHHGTQASFDTDILTDIPRARNHNGGRIAIRDDYLFITTGDTFQASRAQDTDDLAGKILRLYLDGSIPQDNPFSNEVYSYGHRNPQGITWHADGTMYSSEHGPSGDGGAFAHDEINIIKKGNNYGWPEVIGAAQDEAYEDPIVVWKDAAVPPGGLVFWEGDLYVATLRSRSLIRIQLQNHSPTRIERWFATDIYEGSYGRLRDATVGPDGALYVTTSNRDGRGFPQDGDDKVLRITSVV